MNLVAWEKITKSKKLGGLGLRIVRETNTALLGKLVCDMQQKSSKVWVEVLEGKYVTDGHFLYGRHTHGSWVWNSIYKAKETLKDG